MKPKVLVNKALSLREVFGPFLYISFFFFISFGNFFRIFSGFTSIENVVATEGLLYLFGMLTYLFQKKPPREIPLFLGFSLIVVLSFLYGGFLSGEWSYSALFYSVRLIGMVISGLALGNYFFDRFSDDFLRFTDAFLKPYKVALLIGFVLFILFPYSTFLWMFLEKVGVSFQGDPHVGRFVSVYFDPNYYCVIAGIPLILTLFQIRKRISAFLWLFLMIISVVLSWSRSGIATILGLAFFMLFYRLLEKKRWHIRLITFVIGLTILLSSGVVFASFFSDDFMEFVQRLEQIFTDESALARVESWRLGLSYFTSQPLMGLGYNYLAEKMRLVANLSSVDSSLLTLFTTFGLFFSLLLIGGTLIIWMSKIGKLSDRRDETTTRAYSFFSAYCLLVISFASLFNNVLFYPFWMVPMIAVFSYLHRTISKERSCEKYDLTSQGVSR